MSDVDTKHSARRPTDGMLALAKDIADGRMRDSSQATTVPASVQFTMSTDGSNSPAWSVHTDASWVTVLNEFGILLGQTDASVGEFNETPAGQDVRH